MTRLTIRVDENIDFAIEELARVNKTTKSEVIRDALTKYINGMFSDHLSAMDKRLENIENLLEKELHRYNSLLAKNTLYSIAAREQMTIIYGMDIYSDIRTKNKKELSEEELRKEALKKVSEVKDKAWRKSVALLQKHYTDEKLKLNNTPVQEEKKDD